MNQEFNQMATYIVDCQHGCTIEKCNNYLREFDDSIESLFVNNQVYEHDKNK